MKQVFGVKAGYLFFFLAGLKTVTFPDVIFAMNPVTLWYTCRVWFMENDLALCFPGSEAVSLLLQLPDGRYPAVRKLEAVLQKRCDSASLLRTYILQFYGSRNSYP